MRSHNSRAAPLPSPGEQGLFLSRHHLVLARGAQWEGFASRSVAAGRGFKAALQENSPSEKTFPLGLHAGDTMGLCRAIRAGERCQGGGSWPMPSQAASFIFLPHDAFCSIAERRRSSRQGGFKGYT